MHYLTARLPEDIYQRMIAAGGFSKERIKKCIKRMLLKKKDPCCRYFYQMKDEAEETFQPHLCVDEKGMRYNFLFFVQLGTSTAC